MSGDLATHVENQSGVWSPFAEQTAVPGFLRSITGYSRTTASKSKPARDITLWFESRNPGLIKNLAEALTAHFRDKDLSGLAAAALMLPGGHIRLARDQLVFDTGGVPTEFKDSDTAQILESSVDTPEEPHTRLARELREITDLPATTLGPALGVSREQFQRWLSGKAIRVTRHGELIYLHTLAADVVRRLGSEQAKLWWQTPIRPGITPARLLKERRSDALHRLVSQIPDPEPIVNGVLQALPVQDPYDPDNDYGSEDDIDGESWSPY